MLLSSTNIENYSVTETVVYLYQSNRNKRGEGEWQYLQELSRGEHEHA